MDEHLKRAIEKQARELAGPSHVEQHIILLKLNNLLECVPDFSSKPELGANSPQRKWIAEAGALISRTSQDRRTKFQTYLAFLNQYWSFSVEQIQGLMLDIVEEYKLGLEISGEADVGNVYKPGEVYKFFSDLKSIVVKAEKDVFLIDPYFNGEAFNNYLSDVGANVSIKIMANKFTDQLKPYIEKHRAQFQSDFQLRRSGAIHDRLIFIDGEDCWIMGGSIKDAAVKPTYLIPMGTELSMQKAEIYNELWNNANQIA
jgi:hypothetical protein